MKGLRAIRVGWLFGVLVLLVGSGCCHCWPWSKDETPDPYHPFRSNDDRPSHLTPEVIHGGIQ
jgi:hypothetical protein